MYPLLLQCVLIELTMSPRGAAFPLPPLRGGSADLAFKPVWLSVLKSVRIAVIWFRAMKANAS